MTPRGAHDSKSEMVFTGERFIPHETDPLLALEHYHRYCFASRFAQGKKILDIACGEGYGSAFLSTFADSVVGIDIDTHAIDHARTKYSGKPNLTFQAGNCFDSPAQGGFDMAVSFELLEHLDSAGQEQFLNNIRRVIKPDGLFIVSSPDRDEYAATYQGKNEFHKHEMTTQEIKSLLETHFRHVHLCGQRALTLSTIWQPETWPESQFRFHLGKNLLENIPAKSSFSPPLYVIAVCSNASLPESTEAESNSFYLDVTYSDQTKDLSRWARNLTEEALKNRKVIAALQHQIDERTAWALNLDEQAERQKERIESLEKELEGRTEWAHSLESDAAKERAHSDEANRKLQESSQELLRIRRQISSSFLYRILSKLKLVPNVWGK